MPDAEGKVRAVFGEAVKAGLVCLAVGFAVAITGNAAVGLIDDREMHRLFGRLGFLAAAEGFRAHEAVAAGHPALGLSFAVHDGVEHDTGTILQRDGTAAALVEVFQLHPNLQSFFSYRVGQGRGHRPAAAIEYKTLGRLLGGAFQSDGSLPWASARPAAKFQAAVGWGGISLVPAFCASLSNR